VTSRGSKRKLSDRALETARRAIALKAAVASVVSLPEFRDLAMEVMEPAAFDYIDGGAWDELTLAENESAWLDYRFRPRVLVDVSRVDPSTTLLGAPAAFPVATAPMAAHGLANPGAEIATARAAAAAGVPFALSTMSTHSIEAVAEAAPDGTRWFQLYAQADPHRTRSLVERAAAAGYSALIVTVDLPVLGYRERDRRSTFDLSVPLGNFDGTTDLSHADDLDDAGESGYEVLDEALAKNLTWDSLATIRSWSGLQLDRVPAAIDALGEVVAAVPPGTEIWVDGGVRRGLDIAIALALGARGVLVGRPVLWALAADGQAGVERALAMLREEFEIALTLLGAPTPAAVRPDHLARS